MTAETITTKIQSDNGSTHNADSNNTNINDKKNDKSKRRKFVKSGFVRDCDSKRIDGIQVYKAKLSISSSNSSNAKSRSGGWNGMLTNFFRSNFGTLRLYNVIFLVLYVYQIGAVVRSSGRPYREFLQKADLEGFQVLQGTARIRAELEYAFRDINDVNRRIQKIGWTDWMAMDIEELVEEKKRDKEKNVLDSIPKHMRVPGRYQTAFWPTLLLGVLTTLHALLLLLQHWSVRFNIFINYEEVNVDSVIDIMHRTLPIELDLAKDNLDKDSNTTNGGGTTIGTSASATSASGGKFKLDSSGNRIVFQDREIVSGIPTSLPSHARIIPSKVGEKDVLVPIQYMPTLGMCIEYHRRRYVYNTNEQMWMKIRCRTDFEVRFLETWKGFQKHEHTISAQIRFGPNLFRVKQPSFMELYKAQILNPFSVFQIFCVLLWAIDDYITYSLFSLFTVLMFEGTVVFQRLKSLQALRGMGNPSRNVYVFRENHWMTIDSAELLPGDIVSLTLVKPHRVSSTSSTNDDKNKTTKSEASDTTTADKSTTTPKPTTVSSGRIQDIGGDIVPADLLLLRGSTVVNEASLTGESVPQMKEGISDISNGSQRLNMKNQHKMNVVYAGTTMLQCQGNMSNNNCGTGVGLFSRIPNPPDNGCTCFVLRTGFASAQGKLVRMIEGSQEKVKGHEYETALLLGMLCIFAMISSSYVLYHGMKNAKRSKYELLLHCIMIVTNVIRPELPMQMALAVNTSLMTLMKLHVFCTEPYRVPVAGKLTACLFDKTGTLTTDELVAVGVCEPSKLQLILSSTTNSSTSTNNTSTTSNPSKATSNKAEEVEDDGLDIFTSMNQLTNCPAGLVLAGCQSLVVYEDQTTGDPLESAALRAMKWHISPDTGFAEPIQSLPSTSNNTKNDSNNKKRTGGKPIVINVNSLNYTITNVQVRARHHFSSKLQRMSCVIQTGGTANRTFAVAKGSPEAVGNMLSVKPDGYNFTSELLSKQGYRVIGLAYKVLESEADVEKAISTRAECETNLLFAGFIAFTCMVRKDTADVLKRLKEGGMSVAMITGDALLTAIHVAKEVNIVSESHNQDEDNVDPELVKNEELRKLVEEKRGRPILTKNKAKKKLVKKVGTTTKPIAYLDMSDTSNLENENDDSSNSTPSLYWRNYSDGSAIKKYMASDVPQLSTEYDLTMTGACLSLALESDPYSSKVLGYIKVFARMSPDAKENVIEALHSVGDVCLMCGDGANDVGALKQADVGVALLSGFGNVNVEKIDDIGDSTKSTKDDSQPPVTAIMSQEHLNQIRALPVTLIKMKIRQLGTDPAKYPEIVEKEDLVKLYQIKAREVAIRRHDEKNELARKNKTKQEREADQRRIMQEKQDRMQKRVMELEAQGVKWANFVALREFANAEMEEAKQKKLRMQGGLDGIEGSASSLAAQLEAALSGSTGKEGEGAGDPMDGRPLVKLGDASIAAPFTSKMPSIRSCVDIVRQGRCTLVTSMQMYQIMALQCLISSYALSALYFDGVKYGDTQMTALGMLGMILHLSISRTKPLDKLSRVQPLSSIFHPANIYSLLGQFAIHLATTIIAVRAAKGHLPLDWEVDLDGQFQPGILNTSVFLVTSVQQVTVFVVNLQGAPFMTSVAQNRPLLWTLIGTFILSFMFASESVPGLNRYFQLVPFPDGYRNFILTILAMDLVATLLWDRLMKFIFARNILKAAIEATTWKDVMSLLQTFCIIGCLMSYFLGNSETWDQLIAMQEEIAANITDMMKDDELATDVCPNGVCEAVAT